MKQLKHYFIQWCLVWCCLIGGAQAETQNEIVLDRYFMSTKSANELVLDVRFDYRLSEYLKQALLSGVTLKSSIYFNLVWHNEWWWDRTQRLASIDMELRYHALSRHYQVVRLNSKEHWNFSSLNTALNHMGQYRNYRLPKLPNSALNGNAYIYMKAVLEPKISGLPLKIRSLFSNEYKIESQGVVWPIP